MTPVTVTPVSPEKLRSRLAAGRDVVVDVRTSAVLAKMPWNKAAEQRPAEAVIGDVARACADCAPEVGAAAGGARADAAGRRESTD